MTQNPYHGIRGVESVSRKSDLAAQPDTTVPRQNHPAAPIQVNNFYAISTFGWDVRFSLSCPSASWMMSYLGPKYDSQTFTTHQQGKADLAPQGHGDKDESRDILPLV